MKKLLVLLMVVSLPAFAAVQPCSGHKGGIAYCSKDSFVCKDGSISGSKQKCDHKIYGSKQYPKNPPKVQAPKKK